MFAVSPECSPAERLHLAHSEIPLDYTGIIPYYNRRQNLPFGLRRAQTIKSAFRSTIPAPLSAVIVKHPDHPRRGLPARPSIVTQIRNRVASDNSATANAARIVHVIPQPKPFHNFVFLLIYFLFIYCYCA